MLGRWLDKRILARRMLYKQGQLEARKFLNDVVAYLEEHRYGPEAKSVYVTLAGVLAGYFRRCPSPHEEWHRTFARGVMDELAEALKDNPRVRFELHPWPFPGGFVPHGDVPDVLTYVGVNIRQEVKAAEAVEAPNNVVMLAQVRNRKGSREPEWGYRF